MQGQKARATCPQLRVEPACVCMCVCVCVCVHASMCTVCACFCAYVRVCACTHTLTSICVSCNSLYATCSGCTRNKGSFAATGNSLSEHIPRAKPAVHLLHTKPSTINMIGNVLVLAAVAPIFAEMCHSRWLGLSEGVAWAGCLWWKVGQGWSPLLLQCCL